MTAIYPVWAAHLSASQPRPTRLWLSSSRATVPIVNEALKPNPTLYDTLAVVAPVGADRRETIVTLQKETADADAEGFAIPEEVLGAWRV